MGNDKDRLFINRFESFVFTVRKILYFGDTKKSIQVTDPKHDRNRFIKYFGTDFEYYNVKNNEFDFNNNTKLKSEFSLLFSYKSVNKIEQGDLFSIFACLSDGKELTASEISIKGARSEKNVNRRLNKANELVKSGTISVNNKSPNKYRLNTDLTYGLDKKSKIKFLKALDFAIKKNNFISYAASYKRLIECRDNIQEITLDLEVEHQMFQPILDELNIWRALSAIEHHCYIKFEYIFDVHGTPTTFRYNNFIPLKIVFDNIYGRSYLITYNEKINDFTILRFDRIYNIEINDQFKDYNFIKSKTIEVEKALSTSWSINLDNSNIQTVIADFKNIPSVEYRLKNELRHGKITQINDDFITFKIDVNDPMEMAYWFLSYGADCIVRKPQCLIDKIVNTLKEMIE